MPALTEGIIARARALSSFMPAAMATRVGATMARKA